MKLATWRTTLVGLDRSSPGRASSYGVLPGPTYPGWLMVGIGVLCAALSTPGQSFGLAFYLEPLMTETGLSRLEISSVYSGATLAAAALLPLLGRWADRSEGGRFLASVLVGLAGAMLLLAFAGGVVVLALALVLLRMLGQGAVGIGTLTLIARWFERRRARALAFVALGYALGEMVFPGIIVGLFDAVGWRGSLFVLGCAYALLLAPLVLRVAREPRPEERRREFVGARDGDGRHPAASPPSRSLREAMGTPVFWGLTMAVSIPSMVMTAVFLHHVALLGTLGWGPATVARAMAAVAVGGIAGTWAGGLVLERIPVRFGMACALAMLALGLGALLFLPPNTWTLHLYGGLLGLSAGLHKVAASVVWPAYYGAGSVGTIKGTVTTLRNAASAAGPPLAAALAGPGEAFGRVLLPFALLCAGAAAATLLFRPPAPLRTDATVSYHTPHHAR